jgi:hypothetical protein
MIRSRNIFIAYAFTGVMAVVSLTGAGIWEALAQQSAGSDEPPSFILGTVSGDPGTTVGIPLYFNIGGGKPIRSAHVEVEFVSNSVKFVKADKGAASAVQDFDVTVDSKDLPPDDKKITRTQLTIDFAVKDADPKKSLPGGLLSFLNFNVPTDAKSFSIELNPQAVSAKDSAMAAVKVRGEAGKIIIALPDEPMAGCFFFAH